MALSYFSDSKYNFNLNNIGVVGTIAAPDVTAIGAIAGYASKFSIEIIKKDKPEDVEVYLLSSHEKQ